METSHAQRVLHVTGTDLATYVLVEQGVQLLLNWIHLSLDLIGHFPLLQMVEIWFYVPLGFSVYFVARYRLTVDPKKELYLPIGIILLCLVGAFMWLLLFFILLKTHFRERGVPHIPTNMGTAALSFDRREKTDETTADKHLPSRGPAIFWFIVETLAVTVQGISLAAAIVLTKRAREERREPGDSAPDRNREEADVGIQRSFPQGSAKSDRFQGSRNAWRQHHDEARANEPFLASSHDRPVLGINASLGQDQASLLVVPPPAQLRSSSSLVSSDANNDSKISAGASQRDSFSWLPSAQLTPPSNTSNLIVSSRGVQHEQPRAKPFEPQENRPGFSNHRPPVDLSVSLQRSSQGSSESGTSQAELLRRLQQRIRDRSVKPT